MMTRVAADTHGTYMGSMGGGQMHELSWKTIKKLPHKELHTYHPLHAYRARPRVAMTSWGTATESENEEVRP